MKGNIIKISRFCTDDGPGIRTTVFLKGCPLRCIWCHNPESQNLKPEIWYDASKCVGCTLCQNACKNGIHSFDGGLHMVNLNNCRHCGECTKVCPSHAVEMIGRTVSAFDILNEAEKDWMFYKTSGGGVTISGGEPLFQSDFTCEILKLCQDKGIHTAIETSGLASETDLMKVLEHCDLVLFDIKETDAAAHETFTHAKLSVIVANLKLINDLRKDFIIRLPIIPGLNDREDHFHAVNKLVKNMDHCKGIEIMPYHNIGAYKYGFLQKKYCCQNVTEPNDETINYWKSLVSAAQ